MAKGTIDRDALTKELQAAEKQVDDIRSRLGLPPAAFPSPASDMESTFLLSPWRCPFCGSTKLNPDDYAGGGHEMTCDALCLGCGASWIEKYALVGADEFDGIVVEEQAPVKMRRKSKKMKLIEAEPSKN